MDFRFKKNVKLGNLLASLLLIEVLLALGAMLFGELVVPFASAIYAIIIVVESKRKKIFTCTVAALYSVLTVVFFVLNVYTLALTVSVIIGAIIAILYTSGLPKAEISFYVCIVYLVSISAFIWFRTVEAVGTFEFSALKAFYVEAYEEIRYAFIEFTSSATQVGNGADIPDTELIIAAFDTIICLLPAAFMISAFVLTGITFKFFSHCLYKVAQDEKQVSLWRFSLPNAVAYAYVASFVMSIFVDSSDTVFAYSVMNFFYVFMFVFAYVGFNFVLVVLSQTRRRGAIIAAMVVAIFLFRVLAIEILSLCGVFFTHLLNKMGFESINGGTDSKE